MLKKALLKQEEDRTSATDVIKANPRNQNGVPQEFFNKFNKRSPSTGDFGRIAKDLILVIFFLDNKQKTIIFPKCPAYTW